MTLDYTAAIGRPATVTATGVDRTASVAGWVADHAGRLRDLVLRHGALRLQGLPVRDVADVAAVRVALGLDPATLSEHYAQRQDLGGGVYAGPDWAADREMCLHHEQSFGVDFPGMMVIGCLGTPRRGGAALLADTRTLLVQVPADVVARFREEGWRFYRNFRPYLGIAWSTAYGVADPAVMETRLAERAIGYRWLRDGTLHTAQRRPAVLTHPVTGDECWFNEVAFFSPWSIGRAERDILLRTFGPNGFPLGTTYGGGGPVSEDAFLAILAAGDRTMVRVPWSIGDVLIVDNLLTAYGREPYDGQLDLVYVMAQPRRLADCPASVPAEPGLLTSDG